MVPEKIQVRLDATTRAALAEWMKQRGIDSISDGVRLALQIGIRDEAQSVDAVRSASVYRLGINQGIARVREALARALKED